MENLPTGNDNDCDVLVEEDAAQTFQKTFDKLVQAGIARRGENTVSLFGSSKASVVTEIEENSTNSVETSVNEEEKQTEPTPSSEVQPTEVAAETNKAMDSTEDEHLPQSNSDAPAQNTTPATRASPLDEITIMFEGKPLERSYMKRRKRFSNGTPLLLMKIKQEMVDADEMLQEKPASATRSLASHLKARKPYTLPRNATLRLQAGHSQISEDLDQTDSDIIFEGIRYFNGLTVKTFDLRSVKREPDSDSLIAESPSEQVLYSESDHEIIEVPVPLSEVTLPYCPSIESEDASPSTSPEQRAAPTSSTPRRGRRISDFVPIPSPAPATELEDMQKTVRLLKKTLQEEKSLREAAESDLNQKIFMICEQMENFLGAVQKDLDNNSQLRKMVNEVGAKIKSLDKDVKEIKETPRQLPRKSRLIHDDSMGLSKQNETVLIRNGASVRLPPQNEADKSSRGLLRANPSVAVKRVRGKSEGSTSHNTKRSRLSLPVEDPANISLSGAPARSTARIAVLAEEEDELVVIDQAPMEKLTFEKFNISDKCAFCWDKNHESDACPEAPTIEDRRARAAGLILCFQCLGYHPRSTCDEKSTPACTYCGKSTHHKALCPSAAHRVPWFGSQETCPIGSRKNTN